MPKRGRGRGAGGPPSKRNGVDERENPKKVKHNELLGNTFLDEQPGPSSRIIDAKVRADPFPDVQLALSGSDLLAAQEALNNHLILKEMFKYLPVPDLLALSLVNNFWNSCARTVLRDHKRCFAYISRERMCKDLKRLDTLLEKSVNPPFNGIGIQPATSPRNIICTHEAYHDNSTEEVHQAFYMNLLDTNKLNCKYLSLKLWMLAIEKNGSTDMIVCPGQAVLQDLIVKSAPTLKGLSVTDVTHYGRAVTRFGRMMTHQDLGVSLETLFGFVEDDQDFTFPNLKFLEVPEKCSAYDCQYNSSNTFAIELLEAAPNVKVITGGLRWIHLEYLEEENKLGAVRELDIELDVNQDYRDIVSEDEDSDSDSDSVEIQMRAQFGGLYARKKPEDDDATRLQKRLSAYRRLSLIEPKLTKMSISTFNYLFNFIKDPHKLFPQMVEIYTDLLNGSYDTLKELSVAHLDLILLLRLSKKPLPRVNTLTIYFYDHKLTWALKCFDATKLLPSLNSVVIKCELCMRYNNKTWAQEMKKYEDLFITKQMYSRKMDEHTWPLVTNLRYEDAVIYRNNRKENHFDENFVKLFPNIKSVLFDKYDLFGPACTLMSTHWSALEFVTFLNLPDTVMYKCHDHLFSGILKTKYAAVQKAILKEQDVKKLIKTYQSEPSLRSLTKLQKFRVEFSHTKTCKNIPLRSAFPPEYQGFPYRPHYREEERARAAPLKYGGLFLSEVTKKFTLDQMPNLSFEIKGSTCNIPGKLCCLGLENLEPHVKLFIKKQTLKISLERLNEV